MITLERDAAGEEERMRCLKAWAADLPDTFMRSSKRYRRERVSRQSY